MVFSISGAETPTPFPRASVPSRQALGNVVAVATLAFSRSLVDKAVRRFRSSGKEQQQARNLIDRDPACPFDNRRIVLLISFPLTSANLYHPTGLISHGLFIVAIEKITE